MSINKLSYVKNITCVTCLSQERKLFQVKDVKQHLKIFRLDIRFYDDEDGICWECRAIISKMTAFRRKALTAQFLLTEIFSKAKYNINIKSLSNLSTYIPSCLSIKTENDAQNICTEKSSIERKPDTEYVDDFDIICEASEIKNEEVDISLDECGNDDESNCILSKTAKKEQDMKHKGDTEGNCDTGTIANTPKDENKHTNGPDTIFKILGNRGILLDVYRIKTMTEKEMIEARARRRDSAKYVNSHMKCDKCLETFENQKVLKLHLRKHKDSGEFQCRICGERFSVQDALNDHTLNHYRYYECCMCQFHHDQVDVMLQHYSSSHNSRKQTIKGNYCNTCRLDFSSKVEFNRHYASVHYERCECDLCGKTFSNKTNLKRHLLQHTGMPMVECAICHKKLRGAWGLRAHMLRTHNDKVDEAAYCPECNTQYKNAYLYRVHLKTSLKHNTVLKHKCPQCEKSFSSRAYVRSHVDSMHKETKEYICHICSEAFKTTIRLRVHVREKHEGKTKPKNKVCGICAKAFNNKANLQQHINAHLGERPFVCKVCGATFSYSGALFTHNKLLHKKKQAQKDIDTTK